MVDQSPLFAEPDGDEADAFAQRGTAPHPAPPPPPPPRPAYGGLAPNPKAKSRRGQVQFFDSADWAMKQGDSGGQAPQSPTPQVLSSLTQAPSGDAPIAANYDPASTLFTPDE